MSIYKLESEIIRALQPLWLSMTLEERTKWDALREEIRCEEQAKEHAEAVDPVVAIHLYLAAFSVTPLQSRAEAWADREAIATVVVDAVKREYVDVTWQFEVEPAKPDRWCVITTRSGQVLDEDDSRSSDIRGHIFAAL